MNTDILFICCLHRWDDTRIFHKEARSLSKAGFKCGILAPECKDTGYVDPGKIIIKTYKYNQKVFIRLSKMYNCFLQAFNSKTKSLHACEVESWIVALVVKLFRPGQKVVFDVHEVYSYYYAERLPKMFQNTSQILFKMFFHLLSYFTDALVFAKIGASLDFEKTKVKKIYALNYVNSEKVVDKLVDDSKHIKYFAIHIGAFSKIRGWPQLLEGLALSKNNSINVLILGTIVDGIEEFNELAIKLGVKDRITIINHVSYDKVFEYLSQSLVGLMLYQPGLTNHLYAFPLKLYDYMAAGNFVIAPGFSVEVSPVVNHVDNGILLDTSNPQRISEALDFIYQNQNICRQKGLKGINAIKNKYNWEKQFLKLQLYYNESLNSND